MNALPWWWSHLSLSLLVAAVVVAAARAWHARRRSSLSRWFSILALAAGMAVSVIPAREVDVAGFLLAYSGELSFASLFYLLIYLLSPPRDWGMGTGERDWNRPRFAWVLAGLALYVSALGGRGPDVYAMGFGMTCAWGALGLSAGLAVAGRWLAAVLLLGITVAWQLRLSGGANFWDYAIDPFIFLGSLSYVLLSVPAAAMSLSGTKRVRKRKLAIAPPDAVSAAAS